MAKRILIVDDSLIVRQQVVMALLNAGFDVVEAANGREGLHAASSDTNLAMIICDVNMPVMGGIEMLAELANRKSSIPVLMLTSEGQPELISRAKALGAKGWMIKPVDAELLVATVAKLARAGSPPAQ